MIHGVTAIKTDDVHVRHRERLKMLALAVVAGAFVVSIAPATTSLGPAQMPPPKLIPETIAMGAFYDGARVRIEGTAPAGSGVLIVIEGSERDEFFNRKGRVGPIWLTVDRIHVKHAPSVFFRFSSAALGSLVDPEDIQKYQLDEAAIMDRIRVLCHCKCSLTDRSQQSGAHDTVPDASYAKLLYADFLRLKQNEGAYREQTGTVNLVPFDSATRYALEFEWPRNVPPGSYRVTAYASRQHRVIARSTATLRLVEVGFPAYMANMASTKPWIYGSGAVLAAVLAGFLTDLLTSRLGRKRRSRTKNEIPQAELPVAVQEKAPDETHEAETTHRG